MCFFEGGDGSKALFAAEKTGIKNVTIFERNYHL